MRCTLVTPFWCHELSIWDCKNWNFLEGKIQEERNPRGFEPLTSSSQRRYIGDTLTFSSISIGALIYGTSSSFLFFPPKTLIRGPGPTRTHTSAACAACLWAFPLQWLNTPFGVMNCQGGIARIENFKRQGKIQGDLNPSP